MQGIDWRTPAATATPLLPPGAPLPLSDAVATVNDLRELAVEADAHVRGFSGLDPAGAPAPVAVVDRPEWVRANVEGFRVLVDPLLDSVLSSRTGLGPVASTIGPK